MHGMATVRRDFDPRRIPGCRCWLRADLGVDVFDNSGTASVTRWRNQVADVSGDGTASSQYPKLNQDSRGRTCITFPGSSFLTWALSLSGAKTVAVVLRLAATPGTGYSLLSIKDAGTTALSEVMLDLGGYQETTFVHDLVGVAGATVGYNDALGSTLVHAALHTYNGGANDSTSSYTGQLDGNSKTMAASGAIGRNNTEPGTIGARGGGAFFFNGDIYEIIVYNRVLTAAEQYNLWGYMKDRYNL